MPASRVSPDESGAASKPKGKKKSSSSSKGPGFGDPDAYDRSLPMSLHDIVEMHDRSDERASLADYRSIFGSMLPREQTACMQQTILFSQMVGRLVEGASGLALEEDAPRLIERMAEAVKEVLKVKKVRVYGVDYNSLGLARELWVVSGEPANLGKAISLEEWAGLAVKKRNVPIVANEPRADGRYGVGYLEMEKADKKFGVQSLCAMAVSTVDPLSGKLRPRFVIECLNKEKASGKGVRGFDECDGYVVGCFARACGAAIQWAQDRTAARRSAEFALHASGARSLEEFDGEATRMLRDIFGCESAALFWLDDELECLWRFKTADELQREGEGETAGDIFGNRVQVTLSQRCLAIDSLEKVHAAVASPRPEQEQLVSNVANAPKHPKFDAAVDGASTRNMLSVPLTHNGAPICVLQLRNKRPAGAGAGAPAAPAGSKGKADASSAIFRTDDVDLLQDFVRDASAVFEQAVEVERARETEEYLESSRYCVRALTAISSMLASGAPLDELFPLVCTEATTLMRCDRATLFLVRDAPGASIAPTKELWSRVALGMPPIAVPLKRTSIAGATVVTKHLVNLPDAYKDPRFDPRFDRKSKYRTRSILCVPIIDPMDECIGCLQLINKKDSFDRMEGAHCFFKGKDQELARNFCSVVAIAVASARSSELAHAAGAGLCVTVDRGNM